uniref:Uncharacterized protein n=1 Tax=Arion vulgaris TaxID=1028688 RepID=A0A0B7ATH7_9EUPU
MRFVTGKLLSCLVIVTQIGSHLLMCNEQVNSDINYMHSINGDESWMSGYMSYNGNWNQLVDQKWFNLQVKSNVKTMLIALFDNDTSS